MSGERPAPEDNNRKHWDKDAQNKITADDAGFGILLK
jgi:hypothetical protein